MTSITDRVSKLETAIQRLETWAGPGQVEALIEGQRDVRTQVRDLRTQVGDLRTEVGDLRTEVGTLKVDVAELKTDVGTLKTDMAWVKETLQEVLRRLPPLPGN
jgi:regulator of replication initiation timing